MKEQFREIPIKETGEKRHVSHDAFSLLLSSVARHDYFSLDMDDEFQVSRENGVVQGIFKVWASPIIPELENTTIDNWSQSLRIRPLALFESLEQWRCFSDLADRRLQQIFAN